MPGIQNQMSEMEALKEENEKLKRQVLSVHTIELDNDLCAFWTGFPNFMMLMAIYRWLSVAAEKLKYWRGKKTMENQAFGTPGKPGTSRKLPCWMNSSSLWLD